MRFELFHLKRLLFWVFGDMPLLPLLLVEPLLGLLFQLSHMSLERVLQILVPFDNLRIPVLLGLDLSFMVLNFSISALDPSPTHRFYDVRQNPNPNVVMTHNLQVDLFT